MQIQHANGRRQTAKSTPRCTNQRRQHGGQRMALSLAPARIGNLLKNLQQTPHGPLIHKHSFASNSPNETGTGTTSPTPNLSHSSQHSPKVKLASRGGGVAKQKPGFFKKPGFVGGVLN